MTSEAWPPYCGAVRVTFAGYLPVETAEPIAICTRACHPATELHVDVERGVSWPEPGHFVRNPFAPSSGT